MRRIRCCNTTILLVQYSISNTRRHLFDSPEELGYPIKSVFHQIVDFFNEIIPYQRFVLCGNATSELEQPGQRGRKRETNKSKKFNKQNRNSEREVADVLRDLFAVIARLTLSNLIGMAMR